MGKARIRLQLWLGVINPQCGKNSAWSGKWRWETRQRVNLQGFSTKMWARAMHKTMQARRIALVRQGKYPTEISHSSKVCVQIGSELACNTQNQHPSFELWKNFSLFPQNEKNSGGKLWVNVGLCVGKNFPQATTVGNCELPLSNPPYIPQAQSLIFPSRKALSPKNSPAIRRRHCHILHLSIFTLIMCSTQFVKRATAAPIPIFSSS